MTSALPDKDGDLDLTLNALEVLNRRYLLRDATGTVIETPAALFRRVAQAIAAVDAEYGEDPAVNEADFYTALTAREFLPNSPTLMNAGTPIGQLSACFVLPVEDSMDGIFGSLKNMALIHQSGGGTGFDFSCLRPAGDVVKSTSGIASGPVSFMRIYNTATEVVKQGGRRRGANMGVLRIDHPDILEFIGAKSDGDSLSNFNLSVAATDAFMAAARNGSEYELISPRTGKVVNKLNAAAIFDAIVDHAWRTGDPGLIFLDEINRTHPLPDLGEIESTNPCGELPLLPYESCNLGSINLRLMAKDTEIDWEKLGRAAELGVRFLDNVIDAGHFPVDRIEEITRANRKIGLGVMGFADLLVALGVPYDSNESLEIAARLADFIEERAVGESALLAQKRGSFPNFQRSEWPGRGQSRLRNATLTTVAPTGTISLIAGASSGIEPLFAVSYVRRAMDGVELLEANPAFTHFARKRGFFSDDLTRRVAEAGSVQELQEVPDDVKALFQTTFDIGGEQHIRMQAAWQNHIDNAVSKTVNLPENATREDVRRVFLLAHELRCKGTTVYRYGSKESQVLTIGRQELEPAVKAEVEYGGGCPAGECAF